MEHVRTVAKPARIRDRGPTVRRHVKIGVTDIHYIGKEADELDEQVFLGFDPDAQHEYGMESEAYAKLSSDVRRVLVSYGLKVASNATGISTRYLRKIRDGLGNATVNILKRVQNVTSRASKQVHSNESEEKQRLPNWARAARDRIGLMALAQHFRIDPS